MAARGLKPYARMESTDSLSAEESAFVDDEEAAPSIYSMKSNDRLFNEGRRRRGLLALVLVGVAIVFICGLKAMNGGPLVQAPTKDGESGKFSEGSIKEARQGNDQEVAAAIEESAVVSLSASKPLVEAMALEHSDFPGAEAPADTKEAALEHSDFPGAEVPKDTKETALEHSDFPGAQAPADTKETAIKAPADTKEMALEHSDFPGAATESTTLPAAVKYSKADSLEQSDVPGAEDVTVPPALPSTSSTSTAQASNNFSVAERKDSRRATARAASKPRTEVPDETKAVANLLTAIV